MLDVIEPTGLEARSGLEKKSKRLMFGTRSLDPALRTFVSNPIAKPPI
jgi:hypothetical protein